MMTRPGCLAGLTLLGTVLTAPAGADIYAYTDESGAISLSNVPGDPRYRVLIVAPASASSSTKNTVERGPSQRQLGYDALIETVSRAYGLSSALIHAVVSVESRYDARARSRKGARGLMQLMPGTADRYGVRDAFDPAQNLAGGAQYLRDLLSRFGDDLGLALAAYNAGEGAVAKYGNRIPPYRETRAYVPRVLDYYRRYQAGTNAPLDDDRARPTSRPVPAASLQIQDFPDTTAGFTHLQSRAPSLDWAEATSKP